MPSDSHIFWNPFQGLSCSPSRLPFEPAKNDFHLRTTLPFNQAAGNSVRLKARGS